MALEYVNHVQCDNMTFSLRFVGISVLTIFSDSGTRKHHCPGVNLVANAATSLALCNQVSVLPLIVHSMSLKIDVNMILSSENSGFWTFSVYLNMPLGVNDRRTW